MAMTAAEREWWRRYSRYLNSEGWQLVREAAFRRDGCRCRRCERRGSRGIRYRPITCHSTPKIARAARHLVILRPSASVAKRNTADAASVMSGIWRCDIGFWWRLHFKQKLQLVIGVPGRSV
jgi:hypothetical protein